MRTFRWGVCVALLVLAGCGDGGGNPFVGSWQCVEVNGKPFRSQGDDKGLCRFTEDAFITTDPGGDPIEWSYRYDTARFPNSLDLERVGDGGKMELRLCIYRFESGRQILWIRGTEEIDLGSADAQGAPGGTIQRPRDFGVEGDYGLVKLVRQ